MAKENRILAIDVGGDSLKMAEFFYPESGGIVMEKFAFERFNALDEGVTPAVFAETYWKMLSEHGFTAKRVRLSVSAQAAFVRLSKLPSLIGSKSSVYRLVEYEARQTVPYAIDEIEWDYQLLLHRYTERRQETQEDGTILELEEEHEEFEALFVAMKRELISAYTDVIIDSGKDVASAVIAPVTLYNAARGAGLIVPETCTMLLNIGSTTSTLVIADDQRIFLRSIPIAGNTLTAQIAKEFGVPMSEAEDLKCRYGFVSLGGAYDDVDSELANKISKIARNVLTRLHGEVSRSINVWRSGHSGNAPQNVLLSGGGSTMGYLSEFFNEKLRIPVSYLNTFSIIGLDSSVDREELQPVAPMVQELIGLALSELPGLPLSLSLLPKEIKQQHDLVRRQGWFYASAVVLLLCLGVVALGIVQLRNHNEDLLAAHRDRVLATQEQQKVIKRLMQDLDEQKSAFEKGREYIKARTAYIDILAELQKITPDMMWFTAIEVEPAPEIFYDPMMMDPMMMGNPGVPGVPGDPGAVPGAPGAVPGAPADPMAVGLGDPMMGAGMPQEQQKKLSGPPLQRMSEIKKIGGLRLKGCALSMDGRNLQEKMFMDAVSKSEYFESVELVTRHTQPDVNLTGFEFVIKLKNQVQR